MTAESDYPHDNPYLHSWQKRALDYGLGSLILYASSPLEAAIQRRLAKDLDPGSPFYHQERNGNILRKLRTMNTRQPDEELESFWEASSLQDPRIPSSFAARVRKYRLDELPQFGQVVFGVPGSGPRLSLTGLRPLADRHVDDLHTVVSKVDGQLADEWRYTWLPQAPQGVFSVAATRFCKRESNAEFDPERDGLRWVQYDVRYCQTANVAVDIGLMFETAATLGGMAVQTKISELLNR